MQLSQFSTATKTCPIYKTQNNTCLSIPVLLKMRSSEPLGVGNVITRGGNRKVLQLHE